MRYIYQYIKRFQWYGVDINESKRKDEKKYYWRKNTIKSSRMILRIENWKQFFYCKKLCDNVIRLWKPSIGGQVAEVSPRGFLSLIGPAWVNLSEKKSVTEIMKRNANVGFSFSWKIFDGNRVICVVLAACFETRNRDSGAWLGLNNNSWRIWKKF